MSIRREDSAHHLILFVITFNFKFIMLLHRGRPSNVRSRSDGTFAPLPAPKIKSNAFFLWVQHVETVELMCNAQRYGEEKGMKNCKNMYTFIDDGRELCVYYSWMNRKAMAEGCEWKGYLCYEAGKAATCMA